MIDLARFDDAPAIEAPDGTVVSYAELDALVTRYATSGLVEVTAERSVDFIARCLGAWRGGGAFAPIDRADPRPRPLLAHIPGLAYVIATSGSSGTPKHVLVGHAGLPALLRTQIDAFALGPGARALWLHAPMFDASISDWGTALAAGATLVIPTPNAVVDLSAELAARAITHVDLPPSLLSQLGSPPPALRVVVLGGEACEVERVRALARRLRVVVVYGPTEATVCSSLVVVDPDRWERPLIGQPLPGVTYRVIDGELYIGGDALALGYSDPGETARRFVAVDGVRMYRTGDRVEPTPHGLAFLGRVDRQVKLAGKRVDLDEIEAVLRRFAPNVAVVVIDGRLVAFVDRPIPRDAVRGALPGYLQPRRIVVGELPRTPTGKLDRAALVEPPIAWPADPIERAWCQALGVSSVRATDRFSECGGDSLARLQLHVATGLAIDGDLTFGELAMAPRARPASVVELELRALAGIDFPSELNRPAQPSAVLFTGATGFLGRHLLAAWRRRDPRHVIAIARDPSALAGQGIEVIRGDVGVPFLGLDVSAWRALLARVGTIVQCAATIALGADYDAHAPANVRGTIEMARLCSNGSATWNHISTLSVFASTSAARGRHEPAARPTGEVHGGYAQSKVAAEAIARRSGATIYRLGLLVDTAPRPRDQLPMTIRALAKLGCVPAGFRAARFDLTPVRYAAEAIAALAQRPAETHHIAARRGMTCGELADALAIDELPHPVWLERARARVDDPEIAMAIAAFSGRRDLDLFLATDTDFAVERTAALLAAERIEMPQIDVVRAALETR